MIVILNFKAGEGFSAEFGHNIIHGKSVNNKIIFKYKSSFHEFGSDGICNYLIIRQLF